MKLLMSEKLTDHLVSVENSLKKVMNKYDIKHPLRGPEYDGYPTLKQEFKNHIIGIMNGPDSFYNYKRDIRKTLGISKYTSEEYAKEEEAEDQKERIIMRFRLYGKDGVTAHEYNKLKMWGVVKQRFIPDNWKDFNKIKLKRKTKKTKLNKEGQTIEYYSDVSGSGSSNYTEITNPKDPHPFEENEYGDPFKKNMGFFVRPLCPEIFGKEKVEK